MRQPEPSLLYAPLLVLCTLVVSGCGDSPPKVSDPLRLKASQAQIRFQRELCKLTVAEAPKLRELCELSRDLQIAMKYQGDMRYEYLSKNRPDRIKRDQGVMQWLNFEWTDKDEKALTRQSARYAELAKKVDTLMKKSKGHPMWPKLQEVTARLAKDKRLKKLTDDLNKTHDEIGRELKSR